MIYLINVYVKNTTRRVKRPCILASLFYNGWLEMSAGGKANMLSLHQWYGDYPRCLNGLLL